MKYRLGIALVKSGLTLTTEELHKICSELDSFGVFMKDVKEGKIDETLFSPHAFMFDSSLSFHTMSTRNMEKPVESRTYRLSFVRLEDVPLKERDRQRLNIIKTLQHEFSFQRVLVVKDNDLTFRGTIDTVREKDFFGVLSKDNIFHTSEVTLAFKNLGVKMSEHKLVVERTVEDELFDAQEQLRKAIQEKEMQEMFCDHVEKDLKKVKKELQFVRDELKIEQAKNTQLRELLQKLAPSSMEALASNAKK